jgi:hypothetical protein
MLFYHASPNKFSIDLIRLKIFLLLFVKEEGCLSLSKVRNNFEESLGCLNFVSKLWELFKALIAGVLNEMTSLTNVEKDELLKK